MPQPRRKQPQHDVVAPKTTITLGGKEHRVYYSFDGLARIEELLGVNVLAEPLSTYLATSVRNLTTVLWAGLIHHTPDLDTDDPQEGIRMVRQKMSVHDGVAYINAINAAFSSSMPEPEEDAAPLAPSESPSGGPTSGASDASTSS